MRKGFDVRSANFETLDVPELTPVTIVSADSHATLPPWEFKRYLESKYHYALDDQFAEDVASAHKIVGFQNYPHSEETLEVMDPHGVHSAAGEVGLFDPVWRLRQTEAEGVAAELLHPIAPLGGTPFADATNRPRSSELRLAGARAHNRFLADFCSEAPGRLLGVALVYPWPDWNAAAEDCVRAKEAGCPAVFPPSMAGVDPDVPAVHDPCWDPLWAACQDNDLVVHFHAGFGIPQGFTYNLSRFLEANANHEASAAELFDADLFDTFNERRPLWQMIWGGVFDRFPRLKIAFVEVHADWVPPTLAYLDRVHAEEPGTLKMAPSEYWQQHCAVGASLMRYGDVAVRHEIGLNKLMFGSDYPHVEGTWPNTRDFIRATLDSIPVDEAKAILGQNAIDFYGLDRPLIEKTAKRIGPLPGEILGGGHHVDPRLLEHLKFRIGIDKPVGYNQEAMTQALMKDRAAVTRTATADSHK